jgi:hypothetical protein
MGDRAGRYAALIKHHKATTVPVRYDMALKVPFAKKIEIVPTVILFDASGVEVITASDATNDIRAKFWWR